MSKSEKPATKPTSNKRESPKDTELQKVTQARRQFFVAGLNMSWQLAIVVLVPVIGGHKLDERFSSTPLWTFIGLGLALLLMFFILKRQLQLVSPDIAAPAKGPKQ